MTTTDPDLLALHTAILTKPEEDTPRLMYADRLEELDGSADRAEFIRVQCEIAAITTELRDGDSPTDLSDECGIAGCKCKDRGELRRRERELLEVPWRMRDWSAPCPMKSGWTSRFRRGFVEEIECCSADWLAHHEQLFWSPKQKVPCPECRGHGRHADHSEAECVNCGGKTGTGKCGTGTVIRPHVPTAHPIRRVTLTDQTHEMNGEIWVGGTPGERDGKLVLTFKQWPGIEFGVPNVAVRDFNFQYFTTEET